MISLLNVLDFLMNEPINKSLQNEGAKEEFEVKLDQQHGTGRGDIFWLSQFIQMQ